MHWPPICGSESTSSARKPSRPSSKTWNRPTGPAPTMTASVTVASLERSSDKDSLQCDALDLVDRSGKGGESFLLEPFAVEQTGLILGTPVAQHGDDGVSRAELARDADRRSDVDAAGAAEEKAFLAQQPVYEAHGLAVLDMDGVIERCIGEIGGDPANTDALGNRTRAGGLERAVADEFVQAAAGRIGEYAAYAAAA